MTDRFKFRAWDTEKKGWKGMWIFRGGHSTEYDVSNTEIDVLDLANRWSSSVILMQCTGLKDVDGNLIYEGDIVQEISLKENYTIVFKGMGFWFKDKEDDLFVLSPDIYDLKIIGNIYEGISE